jgi:hypothetical protein
MRTRSGSRPRPMPVAWCRRIRGFDHDELMYLDGQRPRHGDLKDLTVVIKKTLLR